MATSKNLVIAQGCLSGLVMLGVLGLIVWLILPVRWTDPIFYGLRYGINPDKVHRSDEPTDCDWGHAPLGSKGCHYKKTVRAYNAAGSVVAGDDVPKYSLDAKTRPIISYDEGKTWALMPQDPYNPVDDPKVKSVEIGWTRVTD
jgi:hypothetical protein